MPTSKVHQTTLHKVKFSRMQERLDLLAVEEPLEIRIGYGPADARRQRSVSVTMRTPGNDFELAVGFLFTEGIIHAVEDIRHIEHCADTGRQEERGNIVRVELQPQVTPDLKKLERHFYTTSGCGVCGKTAIEAVYAAGCAVLNHREPLIDADTLMSLPEQLRKQQTVFAHTGGLHAAALFTKSAELVWMYEDIGRHNAVDKLIGSALFERKLPLSEAIILVSGRAGFELVQKSLMAGIPVMAAIGAPSSLALELAQNFGMSLAGFLREDQFNIYTGERRFTNLPVKDDGG